jgi:hypothetical protein
MCTDIQRGGKSNKLIIISNMLQYGPTARTTPEEDKRRKDEDRKVGLADPSNDIPIVGSIVNGSLSWRDQLPGAGVTGHLLETVENSETHAGEAVKVAITIHLWQTLN